VFCNIASHDFIPWYFWTLSLCPTTQQIRERSSKKTTVSNDASENSEEPQEKTIKFRNYQPRDAALVKAFVNKDDKEESSLAKDSSQPVIADSDIIKNELRQFQDEEELNILPKNNNWDLKKQLEPKLEKLRRRTQRAIVDILREKMAEESESEEDEGEVEGEM